MSQKNQVRKDFQLRRQALVEGLGAAPKAALDQQLSENLHKFLLRHAGIWGAYRAKADEASVEGGVSQSPHLQWAYPRVKGEAMAFYIPNNSAEFVQNQWKIWEPKLEASRMVEPSLLQGLLIPGIVFDRRGQRIGWGRGFYDRFLQDMTCLRVGVAYSVQISDLEVPCDERDVPMNWIITENDTIFVGR